MLVSELFQSTIFDHVKTELLLTHPSFQTQISDFEGLFDSLCQFNVTSSVPGKMMMDRDTYETAHFVPEQLISQNDLLTLYVSFEEVLSANVEESDMMELDKGLIVAGILYYITFAGKCFSESERKQEIWRMKLTLHEQCNIRKEIRERKKTRAMLYSK